MDVLIAIGCQLVAAAIIVGIWLLIKRRRKR